MDEERQSSYWGRRLSRRATLRAGGMGLAGLAAAVLVGCGESEDPADPTATTTPGGSGSPTPSATAAADEIVRGGTYRLRALGSLTHWFDGLPGSRPETAAAIHGHAWRYSSLSGEPYHLELAESVELAEPTVLIETYHGNFHDFAPANGRAIEAEDVYYSRLFARDDPEHFSTSFAKNATDWDNTEVVSDRVLRRTLVAPRADTWAQGGAPSILPREIIDDHLSGVRDLREFRSAFPASGPFYLDSYTEGSRAFLKRHEGYPESLTPHIDNREFLVIPDDAAWEAAFRGGNLDRFDAPNQVIFNSLLSDMGDRVYGVNTPVLRSPMMWGNMKKEPFTDIRFREALCKAIDRQKIIDAVKFGDGVFAAPPIPPAYQDYSLPESDPLLQDYWTPDPQRARQLLDASGYDGRQLAVNYGEPWSWNDDIMPIVKDQLAQVGINIRLEPIPVPEMASRVSGGGGDFDIGCHLMDGPFSLRNFHSSGGGYQKSTAIYDTEYQPRIDALIEKFEVTVDVEEQYETVQEIQRLLIQGWTAYIPFYGEFSQSVISARVRDYDPHQPARHAELQLWLADGR